MHRRGWHSSSVAVALLVMQVGVSTLGTIGVCMDRPHTHGGVPAPDCLMHQPQSTGTAPAESTSRHHHHQDNSTPSDTARVACSCSSDPLTLLATEIAVVQDGLSIALPDPIAHALPQRWLAAPDVRLAPLAPPPKPSLS